MLDKGRFDIIRKSKKTYYGIMNPRVTPRLGSQIETSSVRRANAARAAGAREGAKGKSAVRVRAKSEGGQNETEIVLSFSAGFVPKERTKSRISAYFVLRARNPARFESKIHSGNARGRMAEWCTPWPGKTKADTIRPRPPHWEPHASPS